MICVFGENGQIAQALKVESQKYPNEKFVFMSSEQANFIHTEECIAALNKYNPDVVINAAAYTAVDKAESEKDLCLQINTKTPIEIAKWVEQNKKILVHYSTDYVFPGTGHNAWKESDITNPLNWYGETKKQAEEGVLARCSAAFIFRTSWVYSYVGNNFVKTMIRLGTEREELKIVNDQIGVPTYAPDIASATLRIVFAHRQKPYQFGIYNLTNLGEISWFQFAQEIFSWLRKQQSPLKVNKVLPILTSEYVTPAQRPLNSRLDHEKFHKTFGFTLPDWKNSLHLCLEKINESH